MPKVDPTLEIDVAIRSEINACPARISPSLWSAMVRRREELMLARLPPFVTSQYDVVTDDLVLRASCAVAGGTRTARARLVGWLEQLADEVAAD